MFGQILSSGGGGLIRGISSMVQKIRERRMRLRKGKWKKYKGRPLPDLSDRQNRLDLKAELEFDNKLIKLDKSGYKVIQRPQAGQPITPATTGVYEMPAGLSNLVNTVKGIYYQNKSLVHIISALVAGWYMLTQTDLLSGKKKSKIKRRKKRRPATKLSTGKTSVRRSSARRSTGKAVMPVKYRKGCKGKKGTELGRCLQYWRKYRKGEIKLK